MKRALKKKAIHEGAKSAVIYTLCTMFSRGLAVITVPIFTRLMTTEQIGQVNIYNSWYALLSVVATLSLTSGGFAVAMKDYSESRDEYQSSILTLTSIIALFLGGIYIINPDFWSRLLELPKGLIVLMLVGFLFAPARDFWLSRQRYEYKYRLAGVVTIVSAILASLLSVLVVIYMNGQHASRIAEGRLYVNYAVIYGVAAILWFSIMRKGKTFYHNEYWKLSLSLSLPLVGYSFAAQILSVSDRMIISKMVGNSSVGIYSTLYTVSTLALLVWQAINASFVPYIFEHIDKEESSIQKVANSLMIAYAMVVILVTYFAPEIVRILAPKEYYEAIYIMPPIAAGMFFYSLANLYSNIAVYYKKTQYVMYPAIVAAIINVVLNVIGIGMFGYMAASYTTLIAYIVLAFLQAKWAGMLARNHQKKEVYDNRRMVILSVVVLVISLLAVLVYHNNTLRFAIIGIGVIPCVLYGKNFLKKMKQIKK